MADWKFIALLSTTLPLSACVTSSEPAVPVATETIAISVGPCFGFCPVYDVTASSNGKIRFVGQRNTAVLGERTREAGATAFRSLKQDLAGFRPSSGTETIVDCVAAVSDTSQFKVIWTDADGQKTVAVVQSGCPGGPGKTLVTLLRDLPARLGFASWAEQTTRPGASRG